MRAFTVIACLALFFTFAVSDSTINVWKFLGNTWNAYDDPSNFICMTPPCPGPFPVNFTDETMDQVRTWYCGADYFNITVLSGWNLIWPALAVYQPGIGNISLMCFRVTVEGDSFFSWYQGGLFFFDAMDFKASNCLSSSTASFEQRSTALGTRPFNPRSYDTTECPGTIIGKLYAGMETQELKTYSRRLAFRNMQGNISLSDRGKIHRWQIYNLESVMEIGNWPGYEPIFNVYGVLQMIAPPFLPTARTKTILSSTTSNFKMVWHPNSFVNLTSNWWIYDLKPTSGPNMIHGSVLIYNTSLQIEGYWLISPSAVITGAIGGNNNLTYIGNTANNNVTLAGSFTGITFFANTTTGTYFITGTFSNCNAILTDRATTWNWNRQGVPGTVTMNNVQIGVSNSSLFLTLRNGDFAFNSISGPGYVNLVNATLTVAGTPYTRP